MEQSKFDDHIVRETHCTIVMIREATTCRNCKKPISVNDLAIRQTTQSRRKQCCPQYYHLNKRCRVLDVSIRSDLNGALP
jgi:predicted sulfurtransferase